MLSTADVLQALQQWAPPDLAWDRDNIGLLIGSGTAEVRKVLVCLDLTGQVVEEAVHMQCDCIVVHHPPIFHPLKSVRLEFEQGRVIAGCLNHGISVIAMHTNADSTRHGLNNALAVRIGLTCIRPLAQPESKKENVVLFIKDGMDRGEAFFRKLQELPATVSVGASFENGISRIEVATPRWSSGTVQKYAKTEFGDSIVACHTEQLADSVEGYGIGAVGVFSDGMPAAEFLDHIKKSLNCAGLRTTPVPASGTVRTVAVCGGAGSPYIRDAVKADADAYVTSDISYHVFQDYRDSIILVDAGHYETEFVFIEICAKVLRDSFAGNMNTVDIYMSRINTNPVRFV